GKIRAIAVTSAGRLPYLPNVQGLSETGMKELGSLEPHTFISTCFKHTCQQDKRKE
ncbi:MAG: hypothetical protein EOO01_23060, partial [Chitinophagaceae bacterium]